MIPFFVLPFTLLVMLASSIGGDRLLWNYFAVQTTAPSKLENMIRVRAAGNRFACHDKEPGPQLGETITRRTAS